MRCRSRLRSRTSSVSTTLEENTQVTSQRIKRPPLERTKPVRNASTLFSPAGPRRADGAGQRGPEPPQQDRAADDVVSRSVDQGYRVIDDYIRQGQKAAQRFDARSWSPA